MWVIISKSQHWIYYSFGVCRIFCHTTYRVLMMKVSSPSSPRRTRSQCWGSSGPSHGRCPRSWSGTSVSVSPRISPRSSKGRTPLQWEPITKCVSANYLKLLWSLHDNLLIPRGTLLLLSLASSSSSAAPMSSSAILLSEPNRTKIKLKNEGYAFGDDKYANDKDCKAG